jgi:hypothetical protein
MQPCQQGYWMFLQMQGSEKEGGQNPFKEKGKKAQVIFHALFDLFSYYSFLLY